MTSRQDYLREGGSPEEADALGLVNEPASQVRDCPRCEGDGNDPLSDDERRCPRCDGYGEVETFQ